MEITYKPYNLYRIFTIFKNITASNLIKILQSFEICLGITDNLSLGSSTSFIRHSIPRTFSIQSSESPSCETKYYRSSSCRIMVKTKSMC